MFRRGNIIGLVVGGLIGYLCSFDIDTSLGSAKVPFYVAMGATFGWLAGLVSYSRPPDAQPAAERDEHLTAEARAEAAEAEVRRLRARLAELERSE